MHDVVSAAPVTDTLPLETSAVVPETARAYLLVHDGGASRVFFLPASGDVTVGRSPTAQLRSDDPSVSRLHAKVCVAGGQAHIVDLGSHNGTRVNGERFEGDRLLQPSDIVSIGNLTLVYQLVVRPGVVSSPADGVDAVLQIGDREVVAAAPAMVQLYAVIRRLARSDIPVLVHGETGSGKENAAHALHHWSPRHEERMLTVNCAALPDQLVESELFGYERGAFSGADRPRAGLFEAASGGTLLLDEVGELSPQAQAKLLRAVESRRISRLGSSEEREIDVRLVAATNRSLEGEVKAGRFRQDLFFRLSAATVAIPPLRSRPQDLPLLARRFLEQACAALGRPVPSIAPATLRLLGEHAWPGNVRELKNAMDYLAATVTEPVLDPGSLPPSIGPAAPATSAPEASPPGNLYEEIEKLERRRIAEALEASGGVQVKAAELIGMPLRTFAGKVRLYGLSRK